MHRQSKGNMDSPDQGSDFPQPVLAALDHQEGFLILVKFALVDIGRGHSWNLIDAGS